MHKVAFVVFDGFQSISLAAQSVFEHANLLADEPFYESFFLSPKGGLVRSTGGFAIDTEPFDERIFDTILVSGGVSAASEAPPEVMEFMRHNVDRSRRTASICLGSMILAQAGLLNGRRATTHWFWVDQLNQGFPEVDVDADRIYVIDGPIWTSAGMTAGIDLALAMVERDMGQDLAHRVAHYLVVYHRRAGGQSQHSAMLEMAPKSDRIQNALSYAKANLAEPLSVDQLADAANLSPRQFSRTFRAETGITPAKAVENLRLDAARLLLERSRHTLEQVAQQTGFVDARRMREAFIRIYKVPPQAIRRHTRIEEPEKNEPGPPRSRSVD
jgi:transcriptional regulator GlxA family with amidase domain